MLFTLVDAIELEATGADASVLEAVEVIRVNRGPVPDWLSETTTVEADGQQTKISVKVDAFASDAWRKALGDRRRHLEICVFSYLAAELRSGDIGRWPRTCVPRSGSRPRRPNWWRTTGTS